MSRSLLLLTLLALANLFVFAVAEAAPGRAADEQPVVAVLDTGVSLADARVLPGIDLVDSGTSSADENGHGTAVAATIAANCGNCAILPVRVLSRAGTASWSRVAAGIVWAVDHGAAVVNVSIAGPTGSEALRAAVGYASARGALVVASAGNGGDTQPQYPAAYPDVVAVAATDTSGTLADWSSRGAWVDVTAAGCERLEQRGAWACGTSFAAPLVAARAAAAGTAAPPRKASRASIRVTGRVRPGSTVRATLVDETEPEAAPVRWFRCRPAASPHDCVPVSRSGSYLIRQADAGSQLVARAVTTSFGRLWRASSARLSVAA